MIDTDRYENHTPGPWLFCIGYDPETDTYTGPSPLKGGGDRVNGPVILSDYQFERGTLGHRADKNLIEDAPLLLKEVQRLRELLVEAAHCIDEMEGMAHAHADPDAFARHAMEFRGNVSETLGDDSPWGGGE